MTCTARSSYGDILARLKLRAMPESVVLPQPESGLMSMTPDIIKGHAYARNLGCHLGQYCCLRATLLRGPYQSEWLVLPHVTMIKSEPSLLSETMSASEIVALLGSLLISMDPGAIKDHTDAQDQGHTLWPCLCPKAVLQSEPGRPGWPALAHRGMVSSGSRLLLRVCLGSWPSSSQGLG